MKTHYAIGDIHGQLDLFNSLINQINTHAAANNYKDFRLVLLGDYVDRGPDSKGVIDRIIELESRMDVVALKGNHEDLMLDANPGPGLEKPTVSQWRDMDDRMGWWTQNGGIQTLESYGVSDAYVNAFQGYRQIDEAHLDWMKVLPTFYENETHYFVHAGVNPHKPLNDQHDHTRMWIRDEWLHSNVDMGKHVVHGHSYRREPELRAFRTNLDTGAVYYGTMTCGVFTQPGGPTELLLARGKSA